LLKLAYFVSFVYHSGAGRDRLIHAGSAAGGLDKRQSLGHSPSSEAEPPPNTLFIMEPEKAPLAKNAISSGAPRSDKASFCILESCLQMVDSDCSCVATIAASSQLCSSCRSTILTLSVVLQPYTNGITLL
jgi:hypothetical protein